ncbi:MAG: hypothetical protein IIX28_02460 [Clostridia bacterium]|nr:hypothetical protein [Clostridia bacterium]
MKKLISLLVAVLLLATLCVPFTVSAADTVIDPEVLNSITEEDETGLGLAFRYTMNMTDVTIKEGTKRTFNSAYVGDQKVVKVGAIVTNVEETGTNPEAMKLENVNGNTKLKDVEGKKLWAWNETSLSFAVRVTKIPVENKRDQIYACPYYIYLDANGAEVTVYGNITNKSYHSGWRDANPIELPAIGTDIDVTKKKDRIRVSAATWDLNDESVREVFLTFKNYTTTWITEEIDYVQYTCYNAAGTALETGTIYIGCIDTKKNKVKTFSFEVPDDTAKVVLTKSSITYWTEWA